MIQNLETIRHSSVELIKTNASDEDVAYAAWVSNFAAEARNRPADRIGGLINFLYSERHMSPFEHGSFTFFVDTPLFVAREFMRHRTWSYNETSGRYKELEPRFYLPTHERPTVQVGKPGAYTFTPGSDDNYAWLVTAHLKHFEDSWRIYQDGLQRGIAKEVARNVLPLGLFTQFYATSNPRNVMQFLMLRNEDQALWEIREVAVQIEKHFAATMPLTYEAYKREQITFNKIKILLKNADLDELIKEYT